jgi:hypothetical protein
MAWLGHPLVEAGHHQSQLPVFTQGKARLEPYGLMGVLN